MCELVAFAEWHGQLQQRVDGASVREHLESVVLRAKGEAAEKAKAKLTPPAFPDALAYLWEWWLELSAARQPSQYGIAALSYVDLSAWSTLTGAKPTAWETATLLAMDRAWRVAVQES